MQINSPLSAEIEKISIYDLAGHELSTTTKVTVEQKLDISHLPTGVYLLKIRTDAGVATKKFSKE